MITAIALQGEKRKDRGIFLQSNNSTEIVDPVYFKAPLYSTNEGVAVIDIIGSKVVYFLNRRDGFLDYNVYGNSPKIRFAKIYYNKKGLKGWNDSRGRFHKI